MPPGRLKTITESNAYECVFCYSTENDEEAYGKMLRKSGITIHYFCMLFSSGLWQKGKRDCDGILGFLPKDIKREQKRGVNMMCYFCKKKGGTIGCFVKSCDKKFHFKCNRDTGGLCQFYQQFRAYCPDHRPSQKVPSGFPKTTSSSSFTCSICMLDVEGQVSIDTLCAPCCGGSWFHKICIQRYAVSAGSYFFKCPLCNNKELFEAEMLKFGIYIPEQDAAWEREPNAYQELLERYNKCDADTCLCPHGRSHKGQEDSQWDILLCSWCGSSGTHLECRGFTEVGKESLCAECVEISSVVKQDRVKQKQKKATTKAPRVAASVEEIRQQLDEQRTSLLKARRAARRRVTTPGASNETPSTSQQSEERSVSVEDEVVPVTSPKVLEDNRLINSTPVVHIERANSEVEVNVLDSDEEEVEIDVSDEDSANSSGYGCARLVALPDVSSVKRQGQQHNARETSEMKDVMENGQKKGVRLSTVSTCDKNRDSSVESATCAIRKQLQLQPHSGISQQTRSSPQQDAGQESDRLQSGEGGSQHQKANNNPKRVFRKKKQLVTEHKSQNNNSSEDEDTGEQQNHLLISHAQKAILRQAMAPVIQSKRGDLHQIVNVSDSSSDQEDADRILQSESSCKRSEPDRLRTEMVVQEDSPLKITDVRSYAEIEQNSLTGAEGTDVTAMAQTVQTGGTISTFDTPPADQTGSRQQNQTTDAGFRQMHQTRTGGTMGGTTANSSAGYRTVPDDVQAMNPVYAQFQVPKPNSQVSGFRAPPAAVSVCSGQGLPPGLVPVAAAHPVGGASPTTPSVQNPVGSTSVFHHPRGAVNCQGKSGTSGVHHQSQSLPAQGDVRGTVLALPNANPPVAPRDVRGTVLALPNANPPVAPRDVRGTVLALPNANPPVAPRDVRGTVLALPNANPPVAPPVCTAAVTTPSNASSFSAGQHFVVTFPTTQAYQIGLFSVPPAPVVTTSQSAASSISVPQPSNVTGMAGGSQLANSANNTSQFIPVMTQNGMPLLQWIPVSQCFPNSPQQTQSLGQSKFQQTECYPNQSPQVQGYVNPPQQPQTASACQTYQPSQPPEQLRPPPPYPVSKNPSSMPSGQRVSHVQTVPPSGVQPPPYPGSSHAPYQGPPPQCTVSPNDCLSSVVISHVRSLTTGDSTSSVAQNQDTCQYVMTSAASGAISATQYSAQLNRSEPPGRSTQTNSLSSTEGSLRSGPSVPLPQPSSLPVGLYASYGRGVSEGDQGIPVPITLYAHPSVAQPTAPVTSSQLSARNCQPMNAVHDSIPHKSQYSAAKSNPVLAGALKAPMNQQPRSFIAQGSVPPSVQQFRPAAPPVAAVTSQRQVRPPVRTVPRPVRAPGPLTAPRVVQSVRPSMATPANVQQSSINNQSNQSRKSAPVSQQSRLVESCTTAAENNRPIEKSRPTMGQSARQGTQTVSSAETGITVIDQQTPSDARTMVAPAVPSSSDRDSSLAISRGKIWLASEPMQSQFLRDDVVLLSDSDGSDDLEITGMSPGQTTSEKSNCKHSEHCNQSDKDRTHKDRSSKPSAPGTQKTSGRLLPAPNKRPCPVHGQYRLVPPPKPSIPAKRNADGSLSIDLTEEEHAAKRMHVEEVTVSSDNDSDLEIIG